MNQETTAITKLDQPISFDAKPETWDQGEWLRFVTNHPDGNIFHTPAMYEVYQRTRNYEPIVVAAFNAQGSIVGLVMAVVQREATGFLGAVTARAVIWGGPLVSSENLGRLRGLMEAYEREVKGKAIYSQIRNLWDTSILRPLLEEEGYSYEEHLDILLDLSPGSDQLWSNLKSVARRNVRKARKNDIDVRLLTSPNQISQSTEVLIRLYSELGLPLPNSSFFEALTEILHPAGYIRYFGAFYQHQLIGVFFVFCFRDQMYESYVASDANYLDKRPNDALQWQVLEWGSENGYSVFDFGGAGKPDKPYGVRDYKLKFGGTLVNYGRYTRVHKPILYRFGKAGLRYWKYIRHLVGRE